MKTAKRDRLLRDPFRQAVLVLAINVLYFLVLNSRIHLITQNDDVYLAAFFNGAYRSSSAYAPFINYVLALFFKGVYAAFGPGINWYTLFLIGVLIAGFSLLSWLFLRKFGSLRGLALTAVLLLLFAFDAYCCLTFTTASFVSSAAGVALLFYSAERLVNGNCRRRRMGVIVSACFCLVGFLLRYSGFLAAFALLLPMGFRLMAIAFPGGRPLRKAGFAKLLKLCVPFVLVFALLAAAWGIDRAQWSREPYSAWLEYSASRVRVYDNSDIVPYDEAPAQYEALGLSKADVQMILDYKLGDSSLANSQTLDGIADISWSYYGRGALGQTLIKMGKALFNALLHKSYVHAFGLIGIAWLLTGKHDRVSILTAAAWAVLFLAEYFILVYMGRYAYDRVDGGLFLTGFVLFAFLLREKPGRRASAVLLCAAAAAVFMRLAVTPSYLQESRADKNRAQVEAQLAALEYLIDNTDHLYLDNSMQLGGLGFLPYSSAPGGVCDRIITMRGWPTHMPIQESILSSYGVSDPYRDCIGRADIRLIDFNIDATVEYIREHYDSDASAVLDEQLYRETGIEIYQIILDAHKKV